MVDILWNIVGASGLLSLLLVVWDVKRGQFRKKSQPSEADRSGRDGPGRSGDVHLVPFQRNGRHPAPVWVHDPRDARSWYVRDRQEQEAWR